jgi:hypothetical protein
METPTESDAGYPEEQPEQVDPDDGGTPQKDREGEGGGREDATDSDPGKATGNPRSAG